MTGRQFGLRDPLRSVVLALAIGALIAGSCWADETQQVVAEIEAMLNRLETSNCEFNRNGTWYRADRAKRHLERKLRAAGNIGTAEEFVTRIASQSSETGRPYLVKCGGADPIESRIWLLAQLRDIRGEPPEAIP